MVDKNNNISIFKTGIEEMITKIMQNVDGLSELEICVGRVLLYIKTIIHEIQHIIQEKLIIEDVENKSFETLITRLSKRETNNNDIGYKCLYNAYPTERLAEIHADRTIIKILEVIESQYNVEMISCLIKKHAIFEEFYQCYEYGPKGTTILYFEFLDKEALSVIKKIENTEMNLEDRVLYGIEITREEYEEMVTKYIEFDERLKFFQFKKTNNVEKYIKNKI